MAFSRIVLLVSLVVTTGCSYDGSVDLTCRDIGATHNGRICSDGYWVALPAEPTTDDPVADDDIQGSVIDEGLNCHDCATELVVVPPTLLVQPAPTVVVDAGPIRIDFDQPANEDIDDFVALVDVQSPIFVANAGDSVDVRFRDDQGSDLEFEVERHDPLTGRMIAWVRLPELRADGSTWIILDAEESDAEDPEDVWNNFEMVFHLDSDADSASGNDAENHGAQPTAAMIGNGRSFDGVEQYIDTDNDTDLDTWSISLWVLAANVPMTSEGPNGPLMREGNYQILWDHSDDELIGTATVETGRDLFDASFGTLEAGTWYHLAATFDGEVLRSYRDGRLQTSNDMPDGDAASARESAVIGRTAKRSDEPYAFFAGVVDEVRVYDGVMPAAWYDASHRNQRDRGSFYALTVAP